MAKRQQIKAILTNRVENSVNILSAYHIRSRIMLCDVVMNPLHHLIHKSNHNPTKINELNTSNQKLFNYWIIWNQFILILITLDLPVQLHLQPCEAAELHSLSFIPLMPRVFPLALRSLVPAWEASGQSLFLFSNETLPLRECVGVITTLMSHTLFLDIRMPKTEKMTFRRTHRYNSNLHKTPVSIINTDYFLSLKSYVRSTRIL